MLLALALLQDHFVGWWNIKMRAFLRPIAAKMWGSTQLDSLYSRCRLSRQPLKLEMKASFPLEQQLPQSGEII